MELGPLRFSNGIRSLITILLLYALCFNCFLKAFYSIVLEFNITMRYELSPSI